MKIQDMQLFLEVLRCGSISAASRSLYISQPALSQSIKKLEQELGTPLMIRRSGKVAEPTRAGEIFADTARQIIPLYEGCLKQLNVRPETRRRHLRIGVPPHQGNLIMSALMSYTDGPLKDMELEFSEAPADAHESSLVNGAIDLAIIRLPLKIQNLECRIVARDPLGIWLRRGSPWETRGTKEEGKIYPSLPLEALKDETLVLPPPDHRISTTINRILKEGNFTPRILKNYQNKQSILLMVEKGLASTIGKSPDEGQKTDRFFRIAGSTHSYNLALVYVPDTPFKRDIQLIQEILEEYFKEHPL